MSSDCRIPANPDIAGIGVRLAIYMQTLFCFLPALKGLLDGEITEQELQIVDSLTITNLVLAFAMLISCIVQASSPLGLTNYHASIVLSMSWLNNSNAFISFQSYAYYKTLLKGRRRIEPTWRAWITYIWKRLRDPDPDYRRMRPESDAIGRLKMFYRMVYNRLAISLGSIHLTLMSALGIWLWSDLQGFGGLSSDSACAVQYAETTIVGRPIPFSSSGLRIVSFVIYGLFLCPGINVLLPVALFLSLLIWYEGKQPVEHPDLPRVERSPSELAKRALPAWIGLGILLIVDIIFILDIELTVARNRGLQVNSEESEWGFGQVLAMLLVSLPLRDSRMIQDLQVVRRDAQELLDNALRKAIVSNDPVAIIRWIYAGADPDIVAQNGMTALERSMSADRGVFNDVVAYTDVKKPFSDGKIALVEACEQCDVVDVRALLENRADPNQRDADGNAPLHKACGRSDALVCVDLLLVMGADRNKLDGLGRLPLGIAIQRNDGELTRLLLDYRANPNMPDGNGFTALDEAIHADADDIVRLLLQYGTDPNQRDAEGNAPLHKACVRNNASVYAVLLLRGGADPNVLDGLGRLPLSIAIQRKDIDLTRLLLRYGANPNMPGGNGRTALDEAVDAGADDIVRLLLEAGATKNSQDAMKGSGTAVPEVQSTSHQ